VASYSTAGNRQPRRNPKSSLQLEALVSFIQTGDVARPQQVQTKPTKQKKKHMRIHASRDNLAGVFDTDVVATVGTKIESRARAAQLL
jgi:hypothetical protein